MSHLSPMSPMSPLRTIDCKVYKKGGPALVIVTAWDFTNVMNVRRRNASLRKRNASLLPFHSLSMNCEL